MADELSALIEALRRGVQGVAREWRMQVEALPPSRERERALAWLFLAEAESALLRGHRREAEALVLSAASYARTARDFEAWRKVRALEGRVREDSRSARRRRRR